MNNRDKTLAALEAVTGLLSQNKAAHFGRVGRVIQAAVKQDFWSQVSSEWQDLRDEGKIPDEYANSESGRETVSRVGRYLDSDYVDTDTLEMIKTVFLRAACANDQTRNPMFYIDIASSLEFGEIQLLQACFRRANNPNYKTSPGGTSSFRKWAEGIASEAGLGHPELVERFADSLSKKYLLNPRELRDLSGIREHPNAALTKLGYALMSYISDAQSSSDTSSQGDAD